MTKNDENYGVRETPPFSLPRAGLYIVSPALLMPCLILLETCFIPAIAQPSSRLLDGPFASDLISTACVLFVSFKPRRRFYWRWFYVWWPILSTLGLLTILILAALAGLPIGREERFPAVLVMLPTIGLLMLISLGSLIFHTASILLKLGRSRKVSAKPPEAA